MDTEFTRIRAKNAPPARGSARGGGNPMRGNFISRNPQLRPTGNVGGRGGGRGGPPSLPCLRVPNTLRLNTFDSSDPPITHHRLGLERHCSQALEGDPDPEARRQDRQHAPRDAAQFLTSPDLLSAGSPQTARQSEESSIDGLLLQTQPVINFHIAEPYHPELLKPSTPSSRRLHSTMDDQLLSSSEESNSASNQPLTADPSSASSAVASSSRYDDGANLLSWIQFSTVGQGGGASYRQRSTNPTACGGFSDIFQCDARLPDGVQVVVAVKKLRAVKMCTTLNASQIDGKLQKRLKREVKIWATLHHRNIAPLLGFNLREEFCIISPWFAKGNIAVYLKANPSTDKISLIQQVAAGVSYLHERKPVIVHGDLKPDNVLVDAGGVPKLIDFGLSMAIEDEQGANSSSSTSLRDAGSARWIAPELLLEEGVSRSSSTDTFSFGCVAFFIFTKHLPFKEASGPGLYLARLQGAQPMRHDIDHLDLCAQPALRRVIFSCWSRNPNERPNMATVLQDLYPPRVSPPSDLDSVD